MHQDFKQFLRHGGLAQFDVHGPNARGASNQMTHSCKTGVPHHTRLRAEFAALLDDIIAENSRMILIALTPPDSVTAVTLAELRDVRDAKAPRQWDARVFGI